MNDAPPNAHKIEEQKEQAEVGNLLGDIANGDQAAFAELHSRFSGLVYATAVQVLQNEEDAEDTAQEVFAAVWAKAGSYQAGRGKPATWLITLARNRAIDRIRSRGRGIKASDRFRADPDSLPIWSAGAPDEVADRSDLADHAVSAVLRLSEEQRQAIQLAFFEGLTQVEIAERTGTPLGTVKARIRRGLNRLRGMMTDESLGAHRRHLAVGSGGANKAHLS